MAEWKPFDLKWGRSIWYCSACEESTEVPTYLGTPMYNFCPMCGANMNMKSENKQVDTPQTEEFKNFDREDLILLIECQKERIGELLAKDEPQSDDVFDYCPRCGMRILSKWYKDEPQTDTEIAKAIVHKMIDDAVIAEDAYPDLRQKMHDAVDEYEPQTDCAWK